MSTNMRNQRLLIIGISFFALIAVVVLSLFRLHRNITSRPLPAHNSLYSQSEFYDEAYASARAHEPAATAQGILVNHHLLASSFIAEAFGTIATTQPVTVVLISPNHFGVGQSSSITSEAVWETPYGTIQPDLESIHAFTSRQLAQVEEAPFDHEHGITGIVAFIKKSLPNARIVPLIVKDQLSTVEARELGEHMAKNIPANSLIVGSFDFSHYLPSRAAQFHDLLSLDAVEKFNYYTVSRLDIDSRPGLALFFRLLEERGATHFTMLEHANSAELTHLLSALETTSYITGYFARSDAPPKTSSTHTALMVGAIEQFPDLAASIDARSRQYAIEYLQRLLIGQERTIAGAAGVSSSIRSSVRRAGFTDLVDIEQSFEWGSTRVVYLFNNSKARARELIDGGASAVGMVAGKPSIEAHHGGIIVSGMGQFLSADILTAEYTTLALGLEAEADQLRVYVFPIRYANGKGKLLVGDADDTLLTTLAENSPVSPALKEQIKKGVLTISLK